MSCFGFSVLAACVNKVPQQSQAARTSVATNPRDFIGRQRRVEDCSIFIDKVIVGNVAGKGKEIKFYVKTKNVEVKSGGFSFFTYSYSTMGTLHEVQAGQGLGRIAELSSFAGIAKDYFELTDGHLGALAVSSDVGITFKTVGSIYIDLKNGERHWLSASANGVAEPFVFDLALTEKITRLQSNTLDGSSYSPDSAIFTKDALPELNALNCQ